MLSGPAATGNFQLCAMISLGFARLTYCTIVGVAVGVPACRAAPTQVAPTMAPIPGLTGAVCCSATSFNSLSSAIIFSRRFIDRGFGDAVLGGADAFDLETRFHQRVGHEELVVHFVEGIRVEKHTDP